MRNEIDILAPAGSEGLVVHVSQPKTKPPGQAWPAVGAMQPAHLELVSLQEQNGQIGDALALLDRISLRAGVTIQAFNDLCWLPSGDLLRMSQLGRALSALEEQAQLAVQTSRMLVDLLWSINRYLQRYDAPISADAIDVDPRLPEVAKLRALTISRLLCLAERRVRQLNVLAAGRRVMPGEEAEFERLSRMLGDSTRV